MYISLQNFQQKFMVCFSIIPMEKQAINFQKLCTMHDHAVKSEFSHGHFKFSGNDYTKHGK